MCVCVCVCVSHRVDARQLSQFLWQRLQLAEVPAALPLLPVNLSEQQIPKNTQEHKEYKSYISPADMFPEKYFGNMYWSIESKSTSKSW